MRHRWDISAGLAALAVLLGSTPATGTIRGEDRAVRMVLARLAQETRVHTSAPPELREFIKERLLPLCRNEVFVREVRVQNGRQRSLEDLKRIDRAWVEAAHELPIQSNSVRNPCAAEIRRLVRTHPALGETIVMDNQGANVGQNELTGDYFQGDEAKWQRSFNEGRGGIYIGRQRRDPSTGALFQHVGLPIIDPTGEAIGAICFAVDLNRL
jgi:hypothetical protein